MSIPQRTNSWCQKVRGKELAKKMAFYKMTGPNSTFPFPLLDQPVNKTIEFFRKEELHANWSTLYFDVGSKARKFASSSTNAVYAASTFTSFVNYTNLGRSFKDTFLVINHLYYLTCCIVYLFHHLLYFERIDLHNCVALRQLNEHLENLTDKSPRACAQLFHDSITT